MFEDFGKSNLVNFLALGLASVLLPKLLPNMGAATGTAVRVVLDLLTESEAEAAEELMEALVSSTMAEINRGVTQAKSPEERRRAVERSVAGFKHRARQRAHRWGADQDDRRRRYRRHLTKLRAAVEQSKERHDAGWQRNVFDDLGESIEEVS